MVTEETGQAMGSQADNWSVRGDGTIEINPF